MHSATLHFDGACKPYNPGGYGVYGFYIDSNEQQSIEGKGVFGQGDHITSNLAEYVAAENGIKTALSEISPDHLHVIGDSKLVIDQLKGDMNIHSERLMPCYELIQKLISGSDVSFQFQHVNRKHNTQAHNLCESAYKEYLYRENRKVASENAMEIRAIGEDKLEIDGHTVNLQTQDCSCEEHTEYGSMCQHLFKAELLREGEF